jgi:hypothetical protein
MGAWDTVINERMDISIKNITKMISYVCPSDIAESEIFGSKQSIFQLMKQTFDEESLNELTIPDNDLLIDYIGDKSKDKILSICNLELKQAFDIELDNKTIVIIKPDIFTEDIMGIHTNTNGIQYLGFQASDECNIPFFGIIYPHKDQLKCMIPMNGNLFFPCGTISDDIKFRKKANTILKCSNMNDAFRYRTNKMGKLFIRDILEKIKKGYIVNEKEIIQEINTIKGD